MHRLMKLRLSAAVALLLFAVTPSQAASLTCPVVPSSEAGDIPPDVCPIRDLDAFANMAWQTFKMLVWPAAARGLPDRARPINDMAGSRVFETYKSDWETFLANGRRPLRWDQYPNRAPVCKNAATMPPLSHDALVLSTLTKFSNMGPRDLAIDPENARLAHLLIAQNGSLARFLVSFDRKAFNRIRTHKLYGPIPPNSEAAPEAGKTEADLGTITLKSTWIEIRNGRPNQKKFFTRHAWVQDPKTQKCHKRLVALVGLHFAHKTNSSPQWIWSSFEHVDNAPLRKKDNPPPYDPPPRDGYTFNDGTDEAQPDEPPSTARLPDPKAYNVERWRRIAETNRTVNESWRRELARSVWANYELVVVEWPHFDHAPFRTGLGMDDVLDGVSRYGAMPTPPCMAEVTSNVANTVIETFVQSRVDCVKPTTCMSCHNSARNYDFIWSIPLKDNGPPSAAVPSTARRSALSTLRAILGYGSGQ